MAKWTHTWQQLKQYLHVRGRLWRRKFWNRKDVMIFFVCLGIAGLFWVLDSLSYTYDQGLSLPIRYEHLPSQKHLINKPPDRIHVHVNASGRDIIFLQFATMFRDIQLEVIENLRYHRDSTRGYLLPSTMLPSIEQQFPSEMEIQDIQPDTIHFRFENIIQKIVPVRLRADLTFKEQHGMLDSVQIEPDSVILEGPSNFVDTIAEWSTEPQEFHDISENIEKTIKLEAPPNDRISLHPSTIKVTLPVVTFTEGSQTIPITLHNVPKGYKVNLYPNQVKVIYQVSLEDYEKVNQSLFQVVADFQEVAIRKRQTVPLSLLETPEYIRNVRLEPTKAEFIVTPKKESSE